MNRHAAILVLLVALAFAAPATAHPYVTDQECLPEYMASYNVRLMGPLAQEFVPTHDRLDVVVLFLEHDFSSSLAKIGVSVRVHSGTLDGPVLGESEVVEIARGAFGLVHLDFASPITLAPGTTHVLEILQRDAGGTLMAWTSNYDAYANGRAFLLGQPTPAVDFLFRTGLDVALPTLRTSWGAIKAAWR